MRWFICLIVCRWFHILWLLAHHSRWHVKSSCLWEARNILIKAGWSEVLEGDPSEILLLEWVLLLQNGLNATKVRLLLVEERRLHRLENELILIHHRVWHFLLLAIVEDTRGILATIVYCAVGTLFGRNYLDVAVVGEEFHVWRAVEEDFTRDRWQRICQIPQLMVSMCKAAIVLEFANSSLLEIATNLRFVIGVNCTNVVSTWVILRHWLNKIRARSDTII